MQVILIFEVIYLEQLWDVIIIGGGQAGLASGYHLKRKGISFLILESSDQATGSWPHYYDSLKLFSPARLSSLPGMKIRGTADHYPRRDEVICYLQKYAQKFDLPIRTNQQVIAVEKNKDSFMIETLAGDRFRARAIINATGSFHNPFTPEIKDRDSFKGEVLHSSAYRNLNRFKGKRVIIVGRGNSAVQIAVELADHSYTSLAVLQPVEFVKQKIFGLDLHYWIRALGLDTFPFWRFGKKAPVPSAVADLGDYKQKIEAGKPDQQNMFTSFYPDGIIWPDGTREAVDTVIFATGYRPNYSYLNLIGALDSDGRALQKAGISLSVPGLYFVGIEGQRSFASATLRGGARREIRS